MKAKYYIYRNLHTDTFSVQYKGKVIAHPTNFIADECEFRVSEKGRQRVLLEKRKNVHAKIACNNWELVDDSPLILPDERTIYYNPYKVSQFQYDGSNIFKTDRVIGLNGQFIYKVV